MDKKKAPEWVAGAVRRAEEGPRIRRPDPKRTEAALQRAIERSEGKESVPSSDVVRSRVSEEAATKSRRALAAALREIFVFQKIPDTKEDIRRAIDLLRQKNPDTEQLRVLSSSVSSPDFYELDVTPFLDTVLYVVQPFFDNENLTLEELDAELTTWMSRIYPGARLHVISYEPDLDVGAGLSLKKYRLELTFQQ